MSRRSSIAADLALALVSLAVSGLGAELYLRHYRPVHGVLYRLHPRFLHTLVPGARRLFVHQPEDGGGSLLVTVNGDGFLGPELRPHQAGLPRVVVYGDSFVAGEFSPVTERFATQLARRLSDPGRPEVEAVNAGVVGYGPDQEALRLEDEIGPLKPDLVVVAVFAGNDFGDLLRDKIFRLDEQGQLQPRAPRLGEVLRKEFAHAERQAQGSRLLQGLQDLWNRPQAGPRRDSLLPEGGFPYLLQRRGREYDLSTHDGSDTVDHLLGDPYDADVSLDPEAESSRYKTALMAQVLRHMADTARRHETPIVFVFIPSAFDLGEGFEHPDTSRFPAYRPFALTDALAGPASAHGLVVLDLAPVFGAALPQRLYFRRDEHWNAAGQALAAEHVAALVKARGLLK
ncbi:MAG TPA: SGNH/GDSL hydrolase family protein [Vicinamibacteria bacterium]|nr:SGNH/GDSL hydrolase family protein [Vicinamibacteria bacterium]